MGIFSRHRTPDTNRTETAAVSTQTKLAVVYYSSTGIVAEIGKEIAEAAEKAGAEVRLLKAAELATQAAIDSNPAWAATPPPPPTSRSPPRPTSSGPTP
ncbi:hypothetical protein GCM10027073_56700 [Streptomyces chlorus]